MTHAAGRHGEEDVAQPGGARRRDGALHCVAGHLRDTGTRDPAAYDAALDAREKRSRDTLCAAAAWRVQCIISSESVLQHSIRARLPLIDACVAVITHPSGVRRIPYVRLCIVAHASLVRTRPRATSRSRPDAVSSARPTTATLAAQHAVARQAREGLRKAQTLRPFITANCMRSLST